jgi:hypothetical protein
MAFWPVSSKCEICLWRWAAPMNILCAVRAGHRPSNSQPQYAGVAELVDAPDSKSGFFGSGGSIPPLGTIITTRALARFLIFLDVEKPRDFLPRIFRAAIMWLATAQRVFSEAIG